MLFVEQLEPRRLTSATTDQAGPWIGALYREFLGRAAEPAGLAYWSAVLRLQGRPAVVYGVMDSAEAHEHTAAEWYREYLGREPVGGEETYWTARLDREAFDRVYIDFVTTREAEADYPGQDLIALYYGILERPPAVLTPGQPPDISGLAYWAARFDAGESVQMIGREFLDSTEYRSRIVAETYAAFLGREPDAAGLAYWIQLRTEAAVIGIAASDEAFTQP